MKILFVVSEINPIIKTGGLADVASALPQELLASGIDIRIALPDYPSINGHGLKYINQPQIFKITTPRQKTDCWVSQVMLPGTNIPVHLFKTSQSLTTQSVYPQPDEKDQDRFLWFSLAVVEWLKSSTWQPDVVHCHDWMTAIIPQLMKQSKLKNRSLLTIHNLFYQGVTPRHYFDQLGIETSSKSNQQNMLRSGINSATKINTVSPTYAKEVLTIEYGCGLEQTLKKRKDDFSGILNGVDYRLYNPTQNPRIEQQYDQENVTEGKRKNKQKIFKEFGFEQDQDFPLFGYVARLTDQKGLDLIETALQSSPLLEHARVIILGVGDRYWERRLKIIAERHQKKFQFVNRFDEELAHNLYAASDFILMPSRFEPCGLTQLIAMKFGSIPIVRSTGGLADTVIDQMHSPETGTGLVFHQYSALEFSQVLGASLGLYQQPRTIHAVRQRAMQQDFSWEKSAQEYMSLYQDIVSES